MSNASAARSRPRAGAIFPARREAARREGRLIGIGLVELRRGHRPRPVRKRVGARSAPRARSWSRPARPRRARAPTRCWRSSPPTRSACAPTPIHVTAGDTAASPLGHGAYASRQAVIAGNARAPRRPHGRRQGDAGGRRDARSLADDLELVDGAVRVKGVRTSRERSARSRMRSAASRASRCRPTSRRVSRPRSTTSRRPSPTPTAATWPRSRSTPRPAGADHALHRRARLRPHDQSDDGRGPGPRRRRARHRHDALRVDALRRRPASRSR